MSRLEEERAQTSRHKLLYTASVRTTGGRDHGASRSSDGRLNIKLSTPRSGRIGTNPEQLLAAGWSACFESAIGLAVRRRQIGLPVNLVIDAEVDLCLGETGYFLSARLYVRLPGLDPVVARSVVDEAQQTCLYSKATRGNVEVAINLT